MNSDYEARLKKLKKRRLPDGPDIPSFPDWAAEREALQKMAASFDAEKIMNAVKNYAYPVAVGIPATLLAAKGIHDLKMSAEPQRDIHVPLSELENRVDKMQAVRTAFQDRFSKLDAGDVDRGETQLSVGRSMFPWRDVYNVDIDLKDKAGESVGEWPGYSAKVYRDKDNGYTGYVDLIFTRKDKQGQGIGTAVENNMIKAFGDLGATKARLMPAFDGPSVWSKEKFGYRLSPDSKKVFLRAFERYTRKKRIPFKDLGDVPRDYPEDFLKNLKHYEPGFASTYYEKPISKTADWKTEREHMEKLATSFDARRNKQYWQLLKRLYGGNDEAITAINKTGNPGIYHGTSANANHVMQEGLQAPEGGGWGTGSNVYGKGVYFGSRNVAERYAAGGGSLTRLALPSELRGSKHLYPDPTKVMSADMQDGLVPVLLGQNYRENAKKSINHQQTLANLEKKFPNPEWPHRIIANDPETLSLTGGHLDDNAMRQATYYGHAPYVWNTSNRSLEKDFPHIYEHRDELIANGGKIPIMENNDQMFVKDKMVAPHLLRQG